MAKMEIPPHRPLEGREMARLIWDELQAARARRCHVMADREPNPNVLSGVTLVPFLVVCLGGEIGLAASSETGPSFRGKLRAGDCCWFHPSTYASMYQAKVTHYLRFTFEDEFTLALHARANRNIPLESTGYLNYSAAIARPGLQKIAQHILDAPWMPNDRSTEVRRRIETERLLALLGEQLEREAPHHSNRAHSWEQILLYLRENHQFPINRDSVARAFGISPGTLSRLSRSMAGENFQTVLENLRLQRAETLLSTTRLPVADVAQQCGFTSSSYFAQVFQRSKSCAPSKWRARPAPVLRSRA